MKQNHPLGRGKGGGSQEAVERARGFVVVFYLTFRTTCFALPGTRSVQPESRVGVPG